MKKEKNNSFALRWKTTLQFVFFLMITAGLLGFFVSGARAESVPQVEVGYQHSCALDETGNVYCWGSDNFGQLGDNSTTDSHVPIQVLKGEAASGDNDGTYLTNIKAISIGSSNTLNTCALSNSDNVYCWGDNYNGQLGNNSTTESHVPVRVLKGASASGDNDGTYLTNIKSISAGDAHVCVVSNNDNVYCWGWNGNGQLGDNSTTDSHVPIQVLKGEAASGDNDGTYLTNIKSISVDYAHTCAVSNSNNAYCWGYNNRGQLGNNSTTESHVPVRVLKGASASGDNDGTYLTNIKSVSDGSNHTCAVSNSTNVYCWGHNYFGQLGDSFTTERHTPVQVLKGASASGDNDGTYLTNVKSINVGGFYACAISNSDNTYCWGYNTSGQLGDNSTDDKHTPVQILKGESVSGDNDGTYLTNVKSISGGKDHTCAASISNNVYCWGYNGYGQLGDNSTDSSLTAIQVLGVAGSGYLSLGDTASSSISGSGSVNINVGIDPIISLTCGHSVILGIITGTGQSSLTTNEALCTVRTNNSTGYALSWQASTAYLENQHGDQITAYTPTIPDTPENWTVSATESEWGAKLKSGSTTYNSSVWGNADTYAEGKWLNISASPYQIIARTTETAQEGDNETILFGAEIGSNKFQPTGTYDVDVTFTATTL